MEKVENVILSITGSIIFRDIGINVPYLKDLNNLLRKKIASENKRFFLFIGGGHTSREYQYTAERVVGKVKNEDMHWLGVNATRLNAHLLRTIFSDIAYPKVVIHYDKKPAFGDYKVVICAGWLPGTSTDFDMINLANLLRVKKTYSLLNVAGIYDRDPRLFKDIKLIPRMNWVGYREMIGDWWDPKREIPFDPFASKLAEHFQIKVVFLEGKNLKNLENALAGKSFTGSIIE